MEVSLHYGILAIPPVIGGLAFIAYFEAEATVATIFGFTLGWLILHHCSIAIWERVLKLVLPSKLSDAVSGGFRHIRNSVKDQKGERQTNLKRLLRSQLYCMFATVMGFYLLCTQYRSIPLDLLFKWSSLHTWVFQAAVGHWVCSVLEDILVGDELVKHRRYKDEEFSTIFTFYFYGLVSHHIITISAYMWCLNTHHLSGLCVFGLLFEAPVLVMNTRDLLALYEAEFIVIWKDYLDSTAYNSLLVYQYTLWHLLRTLPCLLYPLSLFFWRKQLSTLPTYSQVVYHLLGCLFGFVNFVILSSVLMPVVDEDKARVRKYRRANDVEQGVLDAVYSDEEEEKCCGEHGHGEDSLESESGGAPQCMRMDDV
jgi:hypothetical protein